MKKLVKLLNGFSLFSVIYGAIVIFTKAFIEVRRYGGFGLTSQVIISIIINVIFNFFIFAGVAIGFYAIGKLLETQSEILAKLNGEDKNNIE